MRFWNQKQYSKHSPFNLLISLPESEVNEFKQGTGNWISYKISVWLLLAVGENILISPDICSFIKSFQFSLGSYGEIVPEAHFYL